MHTTIKYLLSAALLFISSTHTYADDFRGFKWGVSAKEVRSNEKETLIKGEKDFLFYKGMLGGLNVNFLYNFVDDRLVNATYLFNMKHSNPNDFIDDYDKIKSLLTKKYGPPIIDNIDWRDDLYRQEPSKWGLAVSAGHLAYKAVWELDNTTIATTLRGDNYKIEHGIYYGDRDARSKMRERIEKQSLDKL